MRIQTILDEAKIWTDVDNWMCYWCESMDGSHTENCPIPALVQLKQKMNLAIYLGKDMIKNVVDFTDNGKALGEWQDLVEDMDAWL